MNNLNFTVWLPRLNDVREQTKKFNVGILRTKDKTETFCLISYSKAFCVN